MEILNNLASINVISCFVLLMIGHFWADFSSQNDFIAKFKSPIVEGKYNSWFIYCLSAHCAMHALYVLIITLSFKLALIMFITHFLIDVTKCLNKISFHGDQILHFMIIAIISYMFYYIPGF